MEDYKYVIPEESNDAMITNVSKLREIENHLRNIFITYQYQEVILPSFEYVDLYTKLDTGFEPEKMFQYINHEGKSVALRCDFTIPLARLYATSKQQDTARYCYFGSVFRKERRHKGRASEFFQGGIELLNKPGLLGDKECLEIMQQTLLKIPLKNMILEIGSASFYDRLCTLVGNKADQLTDILTRKDISEMKVFVEDDTFSYSLKQLLLQLPTGSGNISVLQQLIETIQDEELLYSLTYLKEVYETLADKTNVIFDLGMVPAMKYYTGLMIKGYSDASAYPIISGGRYDQLLPKFNHQASAIGFCYHIDRILQAMEKEGEGND
jgi:ATP phosphoribosyltransferase regulatory subunit